MVQCSQAQLAIYEMVKATIAYNVEVDENGEVISALRDADEVIAIMKQKLPWLTHEIIEEAVATATHQEAKDLDEVIEATKIVQDQLRKSYKIRKKSFYEKEINNIETLSEHLINGTLPGQVERSKAETTKTLEALRAIKTILKDAIHKSEPAVYQRKAEALDRTIARIDSGNVLPEKRTKDVDSERIDNIEYKQMLAKRTLLQMIRNKQPKKLRDRIFGAADILRLMQTTGEFSINLRQAGFLALTRPGSVLKAMKQQFSAFADEKQSFLINREIFNRPLAAKSYLAGLALLPEVEETPLSKLEGEFMSPYAERLPVIKNFSRAGRTFLNSVRAQMFDMMYYTAGKSHEVSAEEAKVIANFVNSATGRGSLGSFEQHAVLLNRVFYAPRYVASRFQLMTLHPLWKDFFTAKKQNIDLRAVRRLIALEYARVLISLMGFYTLASSFGDIEFDPRSSDFGKIRIGKTRIDPLFGLSQTMVFTTRLGTRQTKSTKTGEIYPLVGDVPFGRQDIRDVVNTFVASKFSPLFGVTADVWAKKNIVGEDVDLTTVSTWRRLLVPMTWNDTYEAMKEHGIPEGLAISSSAFFGTGLQTYSNDRSKKSQVNY